MKRIIAGAALIGLSFSAVADWNYSSDIDKMTSKVTKEAVLKSTNSLSFDFPHKGENRGFITVRQHPEYGLDVFVQVEKGQILCSNYSGCPISVRFDDAQPVKFSGLGPADHDSKTVFFQNPKRFISAASKAKTILVQMNFYQNGAPVLEFKSHSPLKWEVAPAKKK